VIETLSADILVRHILALLPEDGTPVIHRIMRTMLARRLERRIEGDLYFEAIEQLAKTGTIARARGRGGSIFLTSAAHEAATSSPSVEESWSEARLMAPLKLYLEAQFGQSLDLAPGSTCIVADTSTKGPKSGQWVRPDFLFISVMRFLLVPGCQVDVHSFELKAEAGGTVQAVHEALAQTRFTNFGHLVWHVPLGSKAEAKLPEIENQCEIHGIGLILIRNPSDYGTWEILLDPKPKPTNPSTIDAFLLSRLTSIHQEQLRKAVRENGSCTAK
jgi:hypothetical protein